MAEDVPLPPASAPELAPEEDSIHPDSNPRVSEGAESEFVVPPIPTIVDAVQLVAALLGQSTKLHWMIREHEL